MALVTHMLRIVRGKGRQAIGAPLLPARLNLQRASPLDPQLLGATLLTVELNPGGGRSMRCHFKK